MNYKTMGRILSQILILEAIFMIPSLCFALYDGTFVTAVAFGVTIAGTLLAAGVLYLLCRKAENALRAGEGMICVSLSWVFMSLIGALPFVISGEIPHFIDAFFEMVSGFTTTGASVVADVEVLSRAVLYWRSFSHWLGGMGVLVFLLAIAPSAEKNGGFTMHLLRAESPGPNVSKLVPRMKQTAVILYLLYIVLTVVDFLFLIAGRMPVFEAICTAFGTAGTGGFGIKADSLASHTPYIQNVTTVFMLLFGVNFSCYHLLLLKQFKSVFKNEELRLYVGIVAGSIALIVWNLRGVYGTIGETLRHAAFQVASIITTTGFATTDFNLWPEFSKAILLCLMVIGACAGSTGGGMKCARVLLLVKTLRRNIRLTLRPQRVEVIRSDGQAVDERVITSTGMYLAAYVMIVFLSFLLLSLDKFSFTTNFSAVFACFNNIGPGLDAVGPIANYGGYSVLSKLVLITDMLAGRLEIFPILALLSRSTWKHA
ncbi:MAG: TrkH family potassium uptake protein [Clostridia bacterium]|nr:TrkH family potassium uptake protein [Clostridia bacterium]